MRSSYASNFRASNDTMPPLYELRKDPKEFISLIEGPPTRPVCGGIVPCNHHISYFLSKILKPLIKEASMTCTITEDLLSRVDDCNNSKIFGSLDVEALYPRMTYCLLVKSMRNSSMAGRIWGLLSWTMKR